MNTFLARCLLFCAMVFISTTLLAQNNFLVLSENSSFEEMVNKTIGVMLKVPLNARGQENTDETTLRVYSEMQRPEDMPSFDLEYFWQKSVPIDNVPEISKEDINQDFSIFGVLPWKNWGWRNPYWYSYRRIQFYSNGTYWEYALPSQQDRADSGNLKYRLYYFPFSGSNH